MAICPGCNKEAGKLKNGYPRHWHKECWLNHDRHEMGKLFIKKSKYNRRKGGDI